MSTNMDYEFILEWDEFPESFLDKWATELTHADLEDNGVICDINFDFTPYCPGRYDGHPDNMYPASGPDLDINSVCLTVYLQRAATVRGERQYVHPMGYLTVATDHLRPFDDKFLEVAHQFAMDWLDINSEKLESHLLAWAATQKHKNEIDSILSSISEKRYS
jgi:hypothetical protein